MKEHSLLASISYLLVHFLELCLGQFSLEVQRILFIELTFILLLLFRDSVPLFGVKFEHIDDILGLKVDFVFEQSMTQAVYCDYSIRVTNSLENKL